MECFLNGYAQLGESRETLKLFCSVNEPEMKFNKFTLCTILKGCVISGDLTAGQVLHCIALKIGCESAEFLGCSLVDMYSKCGLVDDALLVFSNLKCNDNVIWSAMIDCLAQNGREYEAVELFSSMKRVGLTPNQYTLASAATLLGVLYCKTIHAYVYKYGFESDNVICNAMITMYLGLGLFNDSYHVFSDMSYETLYHGIAFCLDLITRELVIKGLQYLSECLLKVTLLEHAPISVPISVPWDYVLALQISTLEGRCMHVLLKTALAVITT